MTGAELEAMWALAQGLFPHAHEPGSERVQQAWRPTLIRYAIADVAEALAWLAERSPGFPRLAELVERVGGQQVQAEREAETLRLTTPVATVAPGSREHRLADFDRGIAEQVAEEKAEAMRCARQCGMSEEWLAKRLSEIERPGPFVARARRIIAGEVAPGEGLEEFMASLSHSLAPTYAVPKEPPEARVQRIVDDFEAHPDEWTAERVGGLPDELRALVRTEIRRRRAAA